MEKHLPLISVFIPVYNQVNYIHQTLDSVINQNYPAIEIVVGDDGSTDGTQEAILEYQKKYPTLIKPIFSKKQSGITNNCNRILENCTGEFIAFLGGDDIWLPTKLIKQIDWFNNNPDAVLCYTKTAIFLEEPQNVLAYQPINSLSELKQMDVFEIIYKLGAAESSIIIKSNAVPKNGFEKNIPNVSDWLFYVEVINKRNFGGIDEVLTMYRRHKNNISNDLTTIYSEHMLTLKIAEKKFPEEIEIINKWKIKTLINLVNGNEEVGLSVVNKSNAWLFFKHSLKFLTKTQVFKILTKWYLIKKEFYSNNPLNTNQ